MSGGRIYTLHGDGTLETMDETPYAAEELLQRLLAEHPDLLAGDQLDPTEPLKWLLVTREMGVPDREGGQGRWSLDHLFIDHRGVPTLVEVKRASDTRARREVVAQMLDYAANAVVHWPIDLIRSKFEGTSLAAGRDPGTLVAQATGDADVEDFWRRVKANLQAGRIRMLFVADQIHPELERIIEFLNTQMDPAEVLAVEVRQFSGDVGSVLVPRVIGRTAEAVTRKSTSRYSRAWDEEGFLDDLGARVGADAVGVAESLFAWARSRRIPVEYGTGGQTGTAAFRVLVNGKAHHAFNMLSTGFIQIGFGSIGRLAAFESLEMRHALMERFNGIAGVELAPEDADRWPTFSVDLLMNDESMQRLLATYDWYADQVGGGGV